MQNLFRRPSGVYVLRIAVPAILRPVFGKREIVASTGTRELTLAKMVAGSQAAHWRQRFFDTMRLVTSTITTQMKNDDILRIADGHPLLLGASYLSLPQASTASGIGVEDLLRAANDGKLSLYYRAVRNPGYLVSLSSLQLDDPC